MTYTERHIVEAYSGLFEGLNSGSKIELIERLSQSLNAEENKRNEAFYNSFGAFSSDKSVEDIVREIKESRKFRNRDIKL